LGGGAAAVAQGFERYCPNFSASDARCEQLTQEFRSLTLVDCSSSVGEIKSQLRLTDDVFTTCCPDALPRGLRQVVKYLSDLRDDRGEEGERGECRRPAAAKATREQKKALTAVIAPPPTPTVVDGGAAPDDRNVADGRVPESTRAEARPGPPERSAVAADRAAGPRAVTSLKPGVYHGLGRFVARPGDGCTYEDESQLTVVLLDDGTVSWTGLSGAFATCPGHVVQPTRCRHAGSGTLTLDGRVPVLALGTSTSAGITLSDIDHRVWDCGGARITVPSRFDLSRRCVAMGIADPDPGEVAGNNVACSYSKPWEGLEHAVVKLRRDTLAVPISKKRSVTLKRLDGSTN
jgi:hypothetical protein